MAISIGGGITIGAGVGFDVTPVVSLPTTVVDLVSATTFTLPTGVSISSSVTKVNPGSIAFDGTSAAYLSLTNSAWLSYPTVTFEFWAYVTVPLSETVAPVALRNTSTNQYFTTKSVYRPYYISANGLAATAGANYGTRNVWSHMAYVIGYDSYTWYINGFSGAGPVTFANNGTPTGDFRQSPKDNFTVGGLSNVSFWRFIGNLDEIRFSSGARYTSNFTPPTTPFTVDGTTLALIRAV